MRSPARRSLASVIFDSMYWPATYPAPTIPSPIAKPVRFRRSHLRVAVIILFAGRHPVTIPDLEQREKSELATALEYQLLSWYSVTTDFSVQNAYEYGGL